MKSLLLIPLLALSTSAMAGEVMVGVAGGVLITDPLETLDTTLTINPRVAYFFRDDLGLELETGILPIGKTRLGNDHPYFALTPRLNLIGRLWNKPRVSMGPDGKEVSRQPFLRPLLVAGLGGFYKSVQDEGALGDDFVNNDIDFMVNAGPGLMVPLGDTFHLRTDLRWVLNLGSESYRNRGDQFVNWEWNAGIGLNFGGPKDSDKDGILDEEDACVNEAEDKDGFEDEDGCPEADNDKDGIVDADDTCPLEAEDLDKFEDEDGCPETDNDEDGILDADDMCPDVAGAASAKGCPDQDGDTVIDEEDECVDEAGIPNAFGCLDDDSDRIPNYRDECPDVPAPQGVDPLHSNGCPSKVFITTEFIKITDKVYFDTGKAVIKKQSFPLLDEIAELMKANDYVKKIAVEGHTDNVGDPAANKKLSEARANSVRQYLIEHEIAEERLEAVGYGQEKPRVEGENANTDAGRAQNRRVEFHIMEQDAVKEVFVRGVLELVDSSVEAGEVKVKTSQLPKDGTITGETTCNATLTVDAEGMVSAVQMRDCILLPRSVTRRSLLKWTFEPMMVDDAAVPFTVDVSVTYAEGKAVAKIDKKGATPVE